MEQMKPHGRLGGIFMHTCEGKHTSQLGVVSRGQNRGEINRHIELLRIDLCLLYWQIGA